MPITKRLLEFQKAHIRILKNKKNPHFKSTYADINTVLDAVLPVLNEFNVLVKQKVVYLPDYTGKPYLQTQLIDCTDDTIEESVIELILVRNDEQALGSAITYNRRYALVTMLNLEQEDDDGNKASYTSPQQIKEKLYNDLKILGEKKDLSLIEKRLDSMTEPERKIVSKEKALEYYRKKLEVK